MFKVLNNLDLVKKAGAILFFTGLVLRRLSESFIQNIGLFLEVAGVLLLIYWGIKSTPKDKYYYLLYLLLAAGFIAYGFIDK